MGKGVCEYAIGCISIRLAAWLGRSGLISGAAGSASGKVIVARRGHELLQTLRGVNRGLRPLLRFAQPPKNKKIGLQVKSLLWAKGGNLGAARCPQVVPWSVVDRCP